MSNRYDDDSGALPEEDDWFADPPTAPWDPPSAEEQAWPGDHPQSAPPPPAPRRADSRRAGLIVAAVTIAIGVFAVGVLVVRAVGGSDEGTPVTSTAAPTVPDTTLPDATTPDTTLPDTTTPDTTTPDTTTPAGTLPQGVTLRPGDSGDDVIALQEALQQAGYDTGGADGDYGPATSQAVAAFQTTEGLTIDGIAGAETLAALSAAIAAG